MARIRTIKPQFWSSEQIVECSLSARLLFIGLLNFCDDGGVHPASYKRLKMEVFPSDNFSSDEIKSMIDELLKQKLLVQYALDGKDYWQVTGWHHQKIDRPTYQFPKPKFAESSSSDQRDIAECSPPESKGKEINIDYVTKATQAIVAQSNSITNPKLNEQINEVFCYWQQRTNHPTAKLDHKRRRQINQALKLGFDVPTLKKAVDGCVNSKFHMGSNEDKKKYDGINLIFRDAEHIENFIALTDANAQTTDSVLLGAE